MSLSSFADYFAESGGYDSDQVLEFIMTLCATYDVITQLDNDSVTFSYVSSGHKNGLLRMYVLDNVPAIELICDHGPFTDFCRQFELFDGILRIQDSINSAIDYSYAILNQMSV